MKNNNSKKYDKSIGFNELEHNFFKIISDEDRHSAFCMTKNCKTLLMYGTYILFDLEKPKTPEEFKDKIYYIKKLIKEPNFIIKLNNFIEENKNGERRFKKE